MGHATVYSYTLRILTCAQCGAPLEASAAISLAVASHLDVQPWPHAAMAFEALPVEPAEAFQRARAQISTLAGLDAILIDMSWGLTAMMGVAAIETWGMVAEQVSVEIGLPVVSIWIHPAFDLANADH